MPASLSIKAFAEVHCDGRLRFIIIRADIRSDRSAPVVSWSRGISKPAVIKMSETVARLYVLVNFGELTGEIPGELSVPVVVAGRCDGQLPVVALRRANGEGIVNCE